MSLFLPESKYCNSDTVKHMKRMLLAKSTDKTDGKTNK